MSEAADSAVDLWAFCESLYREPDIEAFCLQLQDQQQVNVLVLLWCTWLEAQGLSISSNELAVAAQSINRKSHEVIVPLRQLRRRLKVQSYLPEAVRQEARSHLLKAELVLEKQLLQELEATTMALSKGVAGLTPLSLLVEIEGLEISSEELPLLRGAAEDTLRRLKTLNDS